MNSRNVNPMRFCTIKTNRVCKTVVVAIRSRESEAEVASIKTM